MQPASPAYTRHITIGGLPGTGTTTACGRLQEITKLRHVYTGQFFRGMAKARNMTLEQFGRYCEEHPEVDRELDAKQVEFLRGAPVLLEGRLAGYLSWRERIPAYKVWCTCDPWVRAERIVDREGGDVEDRMAEMRRREESEKTRYHAYYGYDNADLSPYDLVLDTTHLTPHEVVGRVLAGYGAPPARPHRWYEFWRRG